MSDGMYSNWYVMLGPLMNILVTNNVLGQFCVVEVRNLRCNTIRGRKIIEILEMEIIRLGHQVTK